MCATMVHSNCIAAAVIHHQMWSTDIEETDVESMSEGSAEDQSVLGDTSFFDFSFSAAKTDSLPFTVHDVGRSATRKPHHVICYSV